MADKHLSLKDFSADNYRLYVEEPDKNFSREHNYAVIKQVIDENDKEQKRLNKIVEKNAGNVADILASFAKYKLDEGKGKQLEQWLGKHWMTKIYGDKLIEKIKMAEAIRGQNLARGNTLYGGNFYLK